MDGMEASRKQSEVEEGKSVPEFMDLDPQLPAHGTIREAAKIEDTGKPSTTVTTSVEGEPKEVSKNLQKKLAKLQRQANTRETWKAEKREKKKAAKLRKRELAAAQTAQSCSENTNSGLKRKADGEEEEFGSGKGSTVGDVELELIKKKQKTHVQPQRVLEPITLIMDCGFDDKMTDKEIISMSSQLTRCYSVNRLSTRQITLRVTSLNGRLLERYQTVINNQHLRWKGVKFSDKEYEVTDENKDDLIYLTADSPDTIEDMEDGKSYIIGGIVDRNRHKSLCYDKAVAQGIRTAKLPIGEYIKMSSRFVLTTNQVVEIMLKYLECRDWKAAFIEVIPQRKQPKLKPGKDTEMGEQDSEEEGEEGESEEEDKGEEEDTKKK